MNILKEAQRDLSKASSNAAQANLALGEKGRDNIMLAMAESELAYDRCQSAYFAIRRHVKDNC